MNFDWSSSAIALPSGPSPIARTAFCVRGSYAIDGGIDPLAHRLLDTSQHDGQNGRFGEFIEGRFTRPSFGQLENR